MRFVRLITTAGAFRRRPEAPLTYTALTTDGSAISAQSMFYSPWYYSGYRHYRLLDSSLYATSGWCTSYATDNFTTSLDTTPWIDFTPGHPTVLNKVRFAGEFTIPTELRIYGSNTGAFTAADRTLVVTVTCPSDLTTRTMSDWFTRSGPAVFYRFYRIYCTGPAQIISGSAVSYPGISEINFELDDSYFVNERIHHFTGYSSCVFSASHGTATNAFTLGDSGWTPGSTFPGECWIQVVLPSNQLRKFLGWRMQALNGANTTYGRGVPGSYSVHVSTTGAFTGEQYCVVDAADFNAGGFDCSTKILSPFQLNAMTDPVRGIRFTFHSWDFKSCPYTTYPGISDMYLLLSKAYYAA